MGVPFTVALVVVVTQEKGFGTLVLILFPIVYLLMLPVDAFMMLPGNNNVKDEFTKDIPNNSEFIIQNSIEDGRTESQ